MTVSQLPAEADAFARYLRDLTAVLDPADGWCGVFWRRDPEGMRACLDGSEIPPWDVVDSLLQDLAALRGEETARRAAERAGGLYAASAAAHDRSPGGSEAVRERLALMLGEQARASRRERELEHRLRVADDAEAQRLGAELAWVRDDGRRAAARCAELRERLTAVPAVGQGPRPAASRGPGERGAGATAAPAPAEPVAGAEPDPPRHRPRGARFAGLDDEGSTAAALPSPPEAPVAEPRGARFRGAPRAAGRERPPTRQQTADPAALRAATQVVGRLSRLRADGLSGEAHAVLCQAALLPAGALPVLAAELSRAGLEADWATLLWEAASLPPERLAAVAGALTAAGLGEDCGHMLRQGAARPASEIADAVIALGAAGRDSESLALLGAFVRAHPPEESVMIAERDPRTLVPRLLAAAATASPAHERDVSRALRVTGLTK
ncbi:hypothetical protein [Streptomyces sp. NBC_00344]|uniref:hypothetical protein n=1 Tax=Streptomyces sp. NBC_00344 TaxID=2975720 RepID=UPI002E240F4D